MTSSASSGRRSKAGGGLPAVTAPLEPAEAQARARQLAVAGRVAEALALLAAPGAVTDGVGQELLGRLKLAAGDVPAALAAAHEAVRLAPASADAHYTLGRSLRAAGDADGALRAYDTALMLRPAHLDAQVSRAVLLKAQGRWAEAAQGYRAVLRQAPSHAAAQANLAALVAAGVVPPEPALEVPALSLAEIEAALARAEALSEEGDPAGALTALAPLPPAVLGRPAVAFAIGQLFDRVGRTEQALLQYADVLLKEPTHAEAAERAGRAAAAIGLVTDARHYLARAEARPDSPLAFKRALLLPAIHDSVESIAALRAAYARALADWQAPRTPWPTIDQKAWVATFYLAYHGESNRDLQRALARAYLANCPSLDFTAPHCRHRPVRGRRLRIGMLSAFFGEHSIGKTSIGLVESLPRERFEVVLLCLPRAGRGALGARIRAAADRTVDLPGEVAAARDAIASLELDVLFYQDIGMEPVGYFLSFARLAPVQCVSYGHPDTTGVPTMDYFVSNTRYEPPGGAAHYSERLVQLRDLPTLAHYHRPPPAARALTRAMLGIADGTTVYLCPQTLFKLHPDFDRLAAGILERDPGGRLYLIDTYCRRWMETLRARFARTMPALASRIVFLPRQGEASYLDLLALADVILDTPHFNGMNTSLEALATGTPVVTLPGGLQRARHTAAMYQAMDLGSFVSLTEEDYVQRAVALGTEPDLAHAARRLIAERSGLLFDAPRVVTEFADFFERAYAEAGAAGQ